MRKRSYKTIEGIEKGRDKPCRSCANSVSRGGVGNVGTCIGCKASPVAPFSSSLCEGCNKARSAKYYQDVYRFKKYGITKEDFEEMYDGHCHICTLPIGWDCHIDHCHETGKVRGLLCNTCNKGLGLFKDSIANLYAAIMYLKENK
jgi:hypothetical protein